ncbi:MAG: hypothetical protein GX491_19635 [Chloroflexi bacterium]|nr:hypothetical protein [Chloroflexota bacterium]
MHKHNAAHLRAHAPGLFQHDSRLIISKARIQKQQPRLKGHLLNNRRAKYPRWPAAAHANRLTSVQEY